MQTQLYAAGFDLYYISGNHGSLKKKRCLQWQGWELKMPIQILFWRDKPVSLKSASLGLF